MTPEQQAALRREFPPECVGKLPKGGTMLDFVGHAHVTDRLLEVDPEWNWEPVATHPETGEPLLSNGGKGLWIRLTVGGTTRLGYGDVENNKAGNVKELISDALRNAGMRFGIALELWAKTDLESSAGEGTKRTRKPPGAAHAPSTTTRRPPAVPAPTNGNGGNVRVCGECDRPIGTDAATKRAGRIVHVSCSPGSPPAAGDVGAGEAATAHPDAAPAPAASEGPSAASRGKLHALIAQKGITNRHAWAGLVLGGEVTTFTDLSQRDVNALIKAAEAAPEAAPDALTLEMQP